MKGFGGEGPKKLWSNIQTHGQSLRALLPWRCFWQCLKMIEIFSTICEAEKSYSFVFKHGVDISRLSSNHGNGFLFFLVFLRLENSLSPISLPFQSLLRVATTENHSQSDKSRPSASILILFPKFVISRHLHVSVCALPKNVSSLKKNPWRKLRFYFTST